MPDQTKIVQLLNWLHGSPNIEPSDVRLIFEKLNFSSNDLAKWVQFDHPSSFSYGREVIEIGANYELMVVTWLPGDFSMIHNHGDASWGIVQVFGELEHSSYKCEKNQLFPIGRIAIKEGQILEVSPQLIHQMGNNTDQTIISLHFYWNEDPHGLITGNTRLYDVVNQKVLTVNCGAFYALNKDEILGEEIMFSKSEELLEREQKHLTYRLNKITS